MISFTNKDDNRVKVKIEEGVGDMYLYTTNNGHQWSGVKINKNNIELIEKAIQSYKLQLEMDIEH